jgi:hypothetical protein
MRIPFACPSCGAAGTVDGSYAGRPARCKRCGRDFNLPDARKREPEPEGYALEESPEPADPVPAFTPPSGSTFTQPWGDNATAPPRRSKRRAPESEVRKAIKRASRSPWLAWLIRVGIVAALVLAAITFLAPNGRIIAACVLMGLGSLMILVGYIAGAYGAFHEDFLYGFLYLVIPLYTAYYMVTRWDDLWVWLACSTAGVGLVVVGTELARWGGVTI